VKRILMIVIALIFFASNFAHASALPPGQYGMRGKYIGVLLCGDCAGVWTEVTLEDPGGNWGAGSGTFVMTERFTGGSHGAANLTTRGKWTTVDWVKNESYTGTIELRGDDLDGRTPPPRYFHCDHGRSLRLLDSNRDDLNSLKPIQLQRVIPPPQPIFGPVTEAQHNAILQGQIGDVFEVALPAASLKDSSSAWTMKQPASGTIALESSSGSGAQNIFAEIFRVKATGPGKIRVEFQSALNPQRTVAFTFEIAR